METSAIVTGIRNRLETLLAAPQGRYCPFTVDGDPIGWIDAARVKRLAEFADVLVADDHQVRFVDDIVRPEVRTEAMERVARKLADAGLLSAWRNERYAVVREFGDAPRFELERCAARYFGIRTFAAHINGLVRTAEGTRMWLGRRSPHKAVDPGLLDNMVGGGIAAGASIAATVIKEAWEEAGVAPRLAAAAQPVSTLRICRDHPWGLERETIYAHDLWLEPAFVPKGVDGEVVEFRLKTMVDAGRLAANRSGNDVVTADASLVLVDCLMRHQVVAPGTRDYAVLDALRRTSMVPSNNP